MHLEKKLCVLEVDGNEIDVQRLLMNECIALRPERRTTTSIVSFNFLWVRISANVNFISPHSLNHKMVERPLQSPDTGQGEVHTYLSQPLFSQKITCPRTSLIISFSQKGDSKGCPVLFIPPAVCSRWFALPLGMSSCPFPI